MLASVLSAVALQLATPAPAGASELEPPAAEGNIDPNKAAMLCNGGDLRLRLDNSVGTSGYWAEDLPNLITYVQLNAGTDVTVTVTSPAFTRELDAGPSFGFGLGFDLQTASGTYVTHLLYNTNVIPLEGGTRTE